MNAGKDEGGSRGCSGVRENSSEYEKIGSEQGMSGYWTLHPTHGMIESEYVMLASGYATLDSGFGTLNSGFGKLDLGLGMLDSRYDALISA